MPDTKPPHLSNIAPVFPVSDLKAAVAYYRNRLLFESRFEWADTEAEPVRYAILCRDHVELHLSAGAGRHPATAYCFVAGIDGYYTSVTEAGADIAEAITTGPGTCANSVQGTRTEHALFRRASGADRAVNTWVKTGSEILTEPWQQLSVAKLRPSR